MTSSAGKMADLNDPTLLMQQALIGGRWIAAADHASLDVLNPYDGSLVGRVPSLGQAEARRAISVAARVQPEWASRPAKERSIILRRWYDLILSNIDDLALILTLEQGKPLAESRAEILFNAAYIEWYAEEAKRLYGDVIPSPAHDQRIVVLKQPVGVCAAITPWNFPNGMVTRKVGPALAAGCAIVLKPAAETPFSALALARLAEDAGVPAGIFSVITGPAQPIGMEFCHNPDIAKISFTGSTAVGRWLMREAADGVKRLSLELGGNAPFIVFDDADVDAAVEGALISKFRNAGQTCVSANRFYVHSDVALEFGEKLAARVAALQLGSGLADGVQLGPLIDEKAVAKIEAHIDDARSKGATVIVGGRRSRLGGTFFEPTVMCGVTQAMIVSKEETFAPLAAIIEFRDEAGVVGMANDSEFGLAAYFYTKDLGRAWRVAEALQCGIIGVNSGLIANEAAPFGGYKQSGIGREGSRYGIEGYLDIKYICMAGI